MVGAAQRPRPDSFGHFEILQTLGQGGMGTVYLARDTTAPKTANHVALKVLRPRVQATDLVSRFETEREALAIMDHPNIAKMFTTGTCEGSPYIAMEFVPGLSLDDFILTSRPRLESLLEIFVKICEGVDHAHQRNIIHRDLKPTNIIIETDGDRVMPKLIDFGLARAIDHDGTHLTAQGLALGTLAFMSPEQAAGHVDQIAAATDIYSLGVLLYWLVCGVLPFDSEELRRAGLLKAVTRIHVEVPVLPSKRMAQRGTKIRSHRVRKNLDRIIMRALQKKRSDRYPAAAAMAADAASELSFLRSGPGAKLFRSVFGILGRRPG